MKYKKFLIFLITIILIFLALYFFELKFQTIFSKIRYFLNSYYLRVNQEVKKELKEFEEQLKGSLNFLFKKTYSFLLKFFQKIKNFLKKFLKKFLLTNIYLLTKEGRGSIM